MPMYFLGLAGMPRRIYTYDAESGWFGLNFIATIGAFMMGAAFMLLVYNIYYSIRRQKPEESGDAWDGRTLEWATEGSIPPHYNFAILPKVTGLDAFWNIKREGRDGEDGKIRNLAPIHMPSRSGKPFIMSVFFFISGFGLVFEWFWLAAAGAIGILSILVLRSLDTNKGYYIGVEEIRADLNNHRS
jgi:cytochrome aa3-600 menaquinol oxidase subunit 1